MKAYFIFILFNFALISLSAGNKPRLLILSGSNNHDWVATTAVLGDLFSSDGGFSVEVTERPDTMTALALHDVDVVVSNWNSWPDTVTRWPEDLETALMQFIENGGGLVTFHASTSVFYTWPAFRKITGASWEADTHHGKRDSVRLRYGSTDHPVTKGLEDFILVDELWINARFNAELTVVGYARNAGAKSGDDPWQPAVFVDEVGKGRVFHTLLGHDVEALDNPDLQRLLIRGVQWAAGIIN